VQSRDLTYTNPDGITSKPSASFYGTDDGKLGIRVAGMDVDGDDTVGKPTIKNVTLEPGDTLTAAETPLSCESTSTGSSGTGDVFDIGVSLDTTASMGAAAGILADRTAAFATELESRGLDVRFAGTTVGDAFATKYASDTTLFTDSVSTGSLGEPPAVDTEERPDTGSSLINASKMETFFGEVSTVVGSGSGGNAPTENYLGALSFLNGNVAWREGAGRILISIGDQCAHTPATASYEFLGTLDGDFAPPKPTDLENTFVDSGVAVNVVGPDNSSLSVCSTDAYDMTQMASATGGGFTAIGTCYDKSSCNVDLTKLPLVEALTSERATESCDIGDGTGEMTVRMDVEIEGFTWGAAAVLDVSSAGG